MSARVACSPAIGTGVYGFPSDLAAKIAVETIKSSLTKVDHIKLVAFDEPTRDVLEAALRN